MDSSSHLGRSTIIVSWTSAAIAITSTTIVPINVLLTNYEYSLFDWLNLFALLIGLLLIGQNTWAIRNESQAEHQSNLSQAQIDVLAKSLVVHQILWTVANTCIRASAALFLHKIFSVWNAWYTKYHVLFILSIAHGLASVLEMLFVCQPLSSQWRSDVAASCGNQKVSFIAIEAIGLFIDCMICAIPAYIVSQLQLSRRSKIVTICILDLGILVVVISALRLKAITYATTPDFVYGQSYLGMLSALGVMLGVTTCTAPSFARLFRMVMNDLRNKQYKLNIGSVFGSARRLLGTERTTSRGETSFA